METYFKLAIEDAKPILFYLLTDKNTDVPDTEMSPSVFDDYTCEASMNFDDKQVFQVLEYIIIVLSIVEKYPRNFFKPVYFFDFFNISEMMPTSRRCDVYILCSTAT